MSNQTPHKPRSLAVHYLGQAERFVLTLIAFVLVVLAVLLLINNVVLLFHAVIDGKLGDSSVEILDGVLLVMMTMEIVYTVTLSLETRKLVAEPFLVIGIIAAIRRTLVITAESTRLESNPDAFRSTLLELGLLAFIVGIMAVAIYIFRRAPESKADQEAEEAIAND